MRIDVNGEAREVEANIRLETLLALVGVHDGPVAVERNRVIVPRAEHAATTLCEGDSLEIVSFVGGG
jgi:thiamine biosynthesis protein ThiS